MRFEALTEGAMSKPLLRKNALKSLRCFFIGHRLGINSNPERRCVDCGKRGV